MLTLSIRNQITIGLLLVLLMIFTRSHHFATTHSLADASWAVFFLAGFYLRSAWPLLGFLVLGGWLDFAAINWGGIDDFCVSSAYAFLLPAYASLWLAGRWYANRYQFTWHTVTPLVISTLAGLTLCELFSGGGFYFFSGRIADTSFYEFSEQVIRYFPLYIETFMSYIAITAIVHTLFTLIVRQFKSNTSLG